ncbi:MAG: DUF4234 domain-containing protein [Deltaproteobacteria bacterium]|nr:DUF4234 domain-containing protein [Deltaproteobacteria bacterium]MCW5804688.1 DUF4234 domain-containing protein [Deltaproteobacteria bacterium]
MTKRSVASVVILTLVTFGIYGLVWMIKTKNEMVRCGAQIPPGWHIIIPILGLIWMWKFCGGVEHVTQGKSTQAVSFIMLFVLGIVGIAIVQSSLNQAIDRGAAGQLPAARVA